MAQTDPHLAYLAFKGFFNTKPFTIQLKAGSTSDIKGRFQRYSSWSSDSKTSLTIDNVILQSELTDFHSARIIEQKYINALNYLDQQLASHPYIKVILDNEVNARDPKKYGHFEADEEAKKLVTSRISQGMAKYLAKERQYVLDTEFLIGEKNPNDFSWARALNFNLLNIFK